MNMAKNRSELVAEVAEKAGTTNAAVNGVLDAMFQVFEESVSAGEKITIPGWLAVERTDRAARTGRNPQTGETIEIPAGHGVKLTAGSKLKAAVSKKEGHPRVRSGPRPMASSEGAAPHRGRPFGVPGPRAGRTAPRRRPAARPPAPQLVRRRVRCA
jgi:DNA-binding protein HU-beta